MIEENWKDIAGYEGLYKISDLGRIKNRHNRILNQWVNAKGYYSVGLTRNSVQEVKHVHALLIKHFNPKWYEGCFTDHINGVRADNRLDNLDVVDNKENQLRRYRLRGKPRGVYRSSKNSWAAQIGIDTVYHNLGSYPTKALALKAFHSTYTEWHGVAPWCIEKYPCK